MHLWTTATEAFYSMRLNKKKVISSGREGSAVGDSYPLLVSWPPLEGEIPYPQTFEQV